MREFEKFSKEVLRAQDGKCVPLTLGVGGPVVGQAIFRYNEDTAELEIGTRIEAVPVAEWLAEEVTNFSTEERDARG